MYSANDVLQAGAIVRPIPWWWWAPGMGTRRKSSRPRRDRDVCFISRDETETRRL